MTNREQIIQNYIEGYNEFNIEKMLKDVDEAVVFENIENGEITISLHGLSAFREQAVRAMTYFSKRRQTIISFSHQSNQTSVEIDYFAILAIDVPNGPGKEEELRLKGISVFQFSGNKIITLKDIS